MEKESGGRVWKHPHGFGHDQDGLTLPGHYGQVYNTFLFFLIVFLALRLRNCQDS